MNNKINRKKESIISYTGNKVTYWTVTVSGMRGWKVTSYKYGAYLKHYVSYKGNLVGSMHRNVFTLWDTKDAYDACNWTPDMAIKFAYLKTQKTIRSKKINEKR